MYDIAASLTKLSKLSFIPCFIDPKSIVCFCYTLAPGFFQYDDVSHPAISLTLKFLYLTFLSTVFAQFCFCYPYVFRYTLQHINLLTILLDLFYNLFKEYETKTSLYCCVKEIKVFWGSLIPLMVAWQNNICHEYSQSYWNELGNETINHLHVFSDVIIKIWLFSL